jgi:hypothetical protein
MENEIEELLILEEKVKNIKKRIRERKKSKTITIDGEAHETVKNHCASLNVNIGEWVSQTLLIAVENYKEEINCLITDDIDFEEFQKNEKNRILDKYSKKEEDRHLFKSNKMLFCEDMKFIGHSSEDNYPIYEFTGDYINSFKLSLFKHIENNDGLNIIGALEDEVSKGWMIEGMDCVVLSNRDVDLYEIPTIIIT